MVRNHNPTSPAPTTTTSLYSDPPLRGSFNIGLRTRRTIKP